MDRIDFAGIDSDLNEDELAVRESVARFIDAEALPLIRDCFSEGRFPNELIRPMARLGLLGPSIEGYGCAGLNSVSYGIICQELERCDSALRSFVSVQSSLCMWPIHAYGDDEQRGRWLSAMAKGDIIGCFGLTEAQGGSDPLNMATYAKRSGGDWILNGSKMWITNAPIADLAVVWALTDEGVRGFLVERDMPGFSSTSIERKLSLRASATGALFFDNVRLPAASLLRGTEVGLKAPLSCLTQARFGIAWGVLGAARACLDEALSYTRDRQLFGRSLAATQAVQIRLAEMARKITVGEVLALHLGRRKERGALRPVEVSMAKWNNCRAALEVARDARDLLGGAGITLEHSPLRHALNLESVITYEGTETIHQLAVGRELTGLNAF